VTKTTLSRVLFNFSLLVTVFLLWLGCAGKTATMRDISSDQLPAAIEFDKARIVFMKPSGVAFAVQSSVFEVVAGEPELIGIVSANKKVGFNCSPGKHLFMVIGESRDEFKQWDHDCQWTEKTRDADQWAFTHLSSIKPKQKSDLTDWLQRPGGDRPALFPDDGI